VNRDAAAIAGRLSLRPPQAESLEILARVGELVPLRKDQDVAAALAAIGAEYPAVRDFEREFPSLCFALATGVGKTRLMGAFIAWLTRARNIRHFFVLAPNLTIYDKLIRDFTPGHPKYVFQGLAEFAINPPEIITGDNWDSGRAVRPNVLGDDAVSINVFNIAKINTEVRGRNVPRVKRLNEYIGQSYFDYLAGLPDLVLLMDESHRYRAKAGMQAINELRPVLGLELTATPQVERGTRSTPFRNVIYSYPLAYALRDGFVKEPAVATRENFDAASYSEDALEALKLEDGIRIHETAKAELEAYAIREGKPRVKPFVLVVAMDITHAAALETRIKSEDFFEGRYRDKVITVHSTQQGEEREETVARLLKVEDPAEPTEIVVHVNMLKEGWDVTNLYTIIPLRAASSRTLVEQSIGRGLRLPYGKRTGVSAVDRLTIVAHDRFQAIIDEANRPDSPIRFVPVFVGGEDEPLEGKEVIIVPSPAQQLWTPRPAALGQPAMPPPFTSADEQRIAQVVVDVVQNHFGYLPTPAAALEPAHRPRFISDVHRAFAQRGELSLDDISERERVIERTITELRLRTIDIPRITMVPRGEVRHGFHDFDLDVSAIRFQPVDNDILIQHLNDRRRDTLEGVLVEADHVRPEDVLVRSLAERHDVSYDEHAALLYKLAGQVVAQLRSYLKDDSAVLNVLRFHEGALGDVVYAQLREHYWQAPTEYDVRVSAGFEELPRQASTAARTELVRDAHVAVEHLSRIRGMRFGGFRKCLYDEVRFDSDTERRLALLIDGDEDVVKWFRPDRPPPHITLDGGRRYEPDFVVETCGQKYLVESKAANELEDADVQAKTLAAIRWCSNASDHAAVHGQSPWSYVFIPHDEITASATFSGLVTRFGRGRRD
jgi:type III restriction enzyme